MFEFNKNKRLIEGPVEFAAEVEIDRSASEVFPLIDLTDPRFIHAQLGAEIRSADEPETHYDLIHADFEDAVFRFTVLEREPNVRHVVEARMVPQLFALVKSVEAHVIESTGEDSCRVTLTTQATFDPDLSDAEVAGEVAMMSQAVVGDLEKLKLLAEEGIDAVTAFDEDAMEFGIELDGEFDLGDLDIDWDDIEPEQ